MYDSARDNSKADRVAQSVHGREEERRVSFIFGLVESAVGDDQRDIIRKTGVVERARRGEGQVLCIESVGDCDGDVSVVLGSQSNGDLQ